MAALCFLGQLLLMGTLITPAYTQAAGCQLPTNATTSNFTVQVTPEGYRANATYLVTINDTTTFTGKQVTHRFLQALSPANSSAGHWNVMRVDNCSSIDTAVLTEEENAANWTSPESNLSLVEIRAYILFADKSAELRTVTLVKASGPTTAPPTTSPNSVSTVQSSIFSIGIVQLPLLLVTSKLLS